MWKQRNLTKIRSNEPVQSKAAEWMGEYIKMGLLSYFKVFFISKVLLFFSKMTTFHIKTLHIKSYFYIKWSQPVLPYWRYLWRTKFSTKKAFETQHEFHVLSLTKNFLSLLGSQKIGNKVFSNDQVKLRKQCGDHD